MEARFTAISGPFRGQTFQIPRRKFILGRERDCHLVLDTNSVMGVDRLIASINAVHRVAIAAVLIAAGLFVRFHSELEAQVPATPPGKSPAPTESDRKPQPRITVSVKTTRILEPLDEEGYVDYLAALNQMASERVTPDNNAAVSFVHAFGVSGFKPAERTRFFKLLQIEPLRERGEYLTAFSDFVKRKLTRPPTKKELADFDRAMRAPWLGSEFPLVAEWLMSNQKPLDLVIAGSGRPKCYIPLVEPAHSGLDALLLPTVNASITAARALVIRAMLHLGETKISEAKQDLLACHRLGRLIGKVPFVIAAITGVGINNFACMADARLMESGRLS
jgi:hypothetical protein